MEQLILHLIGDYVTQSQWMADNKTKAHWPAFAHAMVYSMPFVLLRPSSAAFLVILLTHFLIDRYRLARYVVVLKNIGFHLGRFDDPDEPAFSNITATGYPDSVPAWMSVWLLIACDNTLHLLINFLALRYL